MQLKEVEYKGKKLVYRTKGEGRVVVLLHGFGEDGTIWKNQYDLFPEHQLIIPDLPGSGGSAMIDDMSMEGLADAVKAIIEAHEAPLLPEGGVSNAQPILKQENFYTTASSESGSCASANPPSGGGGAILIGHSMGGYITLAYAEKYPGSLNAYGLFHSSAFADSDEKKETRRKGIRFMEEHGGYEFLKTSTPNLYSPKTKETKAHLIEEHIAGVRNFSGAAHVKYYEAMMERPDRTEILKNSEVPILFIMGKYDTAVPMEDGLKQSHLAPLSYIHVMENSAHMGMKEEWEESNKILSQFIATVTKPAYT